jgi:ABC-type multidrug transport system ATPase subunit
LSMAADNPEPAIRVEHLTKVFNVKKRGRGILGNLLFAKREPFTAVDDVSFTVQRGEVLGLLGLNGAGKTTIIKVISGLLRPTSGSILIEGEPIERGHMLIGLALGRTMVYNRLTGYDNLQYYAGLYGVEDVDARIKSLCCQVGIDGWLDEYVEHYSDGMKTKLAIARALIHDPPILILDEPTLGLDVVVSDGIRRMISSLGKTVILTTHNMDEAKTLSGRVIILKKGRLGKMIHDPKGADIWGEFRHEDA